MLYIVLFIAISIGFYRDISFGDFDWLDVLVSVLFGFAVTGLLFLITLPLVSVLTNNLEYEYVQVSEEAVFGVNMASNTSGSFALGSGTIDSKPYYYFFKKSGDGLQLSRANSFDTQLLEGDGIPRLTRYELRYKSRLAHWLLWVNFWGGHIKYTLHVPRGTIITDYNIDLGNVGR